ncbi:class I SAM-dependent DNA methyltransferase [Paenibacillus sp. NEAU-GSW1]|uniref:HsdM family class I SAM-dependent methyltransferase n=1 Tax=Paenibacillus sp. NEAU-GSW1 TaxID=2682486 RepID=UPI0012E1D372|nr:N-6 DNA methylase [Paenibacillus sp. NEAU-GSW1]MUT64920.1 N-6 DNA methylase [Paenibacillus sp. NEAU-GSW1]
MAINLSTSGMTRDSLIPPSSLTLQFQKIRNLLAGQATGMNLDQTLAIQLIDLLICKMYDEKKTTSNEMVVFQILPNESAIQLKERVDALFKEVTSLPPINSLYSGTENITLDPELLYQIIMILQPYELTLAKRDAIGEAFEAFIGPSLRGEEGQFFTPRNVVELACSILDPKEGEIVLDPACGTGGFLTEALKHKKSVKVLGIDKDNFLARVAAIQISLLCDNDSSWAFNANSLNPVSWPAILSNNIQPESIDVIMTNPPFGSKISVGSEIVSQYELGAIWKDEKKKGTWKKTDKRVEDRPPQILFIEQCLRLLKPGGRMGIVLPDGILGNQREGYVRHFVSQIADLVAIVDLPLETFLPSTSTKTSMLFLRKKHDDFDQKRIFMAIAERCGHDRRGKAIFKDDGSEDDDFPKIAYEFKKWSVDNASDF